MIKFTGLLFIFLFSALGGHLLAKKEKEQIESAEGMLYLIRTIRQNVAYFRLHLDEIYRQFSHPSLQNSDFLMCLRRKGLKEAYLFEKERFGYDSFTEASFLSFAESVGRLPIDEQIKSCDLICDLLEGKIRESKANFPTKKRLYNVLGISLGIAMIILFL
ncbi:MAG: stage III sporulation protein AB [Clostridia bacterium]|nr:stage III sporulation protein AB [Clostridia bacterium]